MSGIETTMKQQARDRAQAWLESEMQRRAEAFAEEWCHVWSDTEKGVKKALAADRRWQGREASRGHLGCAEAIRARSARIIVTERGEHAEIEHEHWVHIDRGERCRIAPAPEPDEQIAIHPGADVRSERDARTWLGQVHTRRYLAWREHLDTEEAEREGLSLAQWVEGKAQGGKILPGEGTVEWMGEEKDMLGWIEVGAFARALASAERDAEIGALERIIPKAARATTTLTLLDGSELTLNAKGAIVGTRDRQRA